MVFYEFDQNEKNYKFGISVSKKIANAVGRNKIKRQLKSMIDKNIYKKGIKCIIIVRKSYLENDFNQNEIDLNYILDKIKIKGEANEKK
jgi:ribonuclease P protein component